MDALSPNQLKKWLPFVAIVPAFAYFSTVIFQLVYYKSFGIDIFLITPRTDPASFFALIMFGLALMAGYLYLSLISWSYQTVSMRAAIAEDILFEGSILLGSAAGFYHANEISSNSGALGAMFYVSLVIPIMAVVLFWARRAVVIRRKMNNNVAFRDAYISSRPWGTKPGEPPTKFSKARIIFTALILAILALLAVGNEFARSRDTFPMLTENPRDSRSTITIIVGKVDEGYIAREYDKKADKFKPGWRLVNDDNLDFTQVKIKSLNHQQ